MIPKLWWIILNACKFVLNEGNLFIGYTLVWNVGLLTILANAYIDEDEAEGEETNGKVGLDTKNYDNQCSDSIDSLKSHIIRKKDVDIRHHSWFPSEHFKYR